MKNEDTAEVTECRERLKEHRKFWKGEEAARDVVGSGFREHQQCPAEVCSQILDPALPALPEAVPGI